MFCPNGLFAFWGNSLENIQSPKNNSAASSSFACPATCDLLSCGNGDVVRAGHSRGVTQKRDLMFLSELARIDLAQFRSPN